MRIGVWRYGLSRLVKLAVLRNYLIGGLSNCTFMSRSRFPIAVGDDCVCIRNLGPLIRDGGFAPNQVLI